MVICLGLLAVFARIHSRCRSQVKSGAFEEDFYALILITLCILSIVVVIVLCFNIQNAVLVWLAPKVWLLKEFATLLK